MSEGRELSVHWVCLCTEPEIHLCSGECVQWKGCLVAEALLVSHTVSVNVEEASIFVERKGTSDVCGGSAFGGLCHWSLLLLLTLSYI